MRIENVRQEAVDDRFRLAASMVWESSERPADEIWFEVNAADAHRLADCPDPFLALGALIAGMNGEKRIIAHGADPQLAEGVSVALQWLEHWYPGEVDPPEILTEGFVPQANEGRVAASMLSGGIDSLATLRANLLSLPEHHPARIKAGIIVNWNAGSTDPEVLLAHESVELRKRNLEPFAAELGIDLVPVWSNMLSVVGFPRGRVWSDIMHGAAFAAAAHALGAGFHTVFLAASLVIGDTSPWGRSSLADNQYLSSTVEFFNAGSSMSRPTKTALVLEWPEGRDVVSVCAGPYARRVEVGNCGECQKCIRTAVTCLAVGQPEALSVFHGLDRATVLERLNSIRTEWPPDWALIIDAIDPATDPELMAAVSKVHRRITWNARLRPPIQWASNLDRRFLGGSIRGRLKGR